MYALEWRTVYARTRLILDLNFPSCTLTREINTTLHDIANSQMTMKAMIFIHTSTPCLTRSVYILLMTSQSIDGDVTVTGQLKRDHVNHDI